MNITSTRQSFNRWIAVGAISIVGHAGCDQRTDSEEELQGLEEQETLHDDVTEVVESSEFDEPPRLPNEPVTTIATIETLVGSTIEFVELEDEHGASSSVFMLEHGERVILGELLEALGPDANASDVYLAVAESVGIDEGVPLQLEAIVGPATQGATTPYSWDRALSAEQDPAAGAYACSNSWFTNSFASEGVSGNTRLFFRLDSYATQTPPWINSGEGWYWYTATRYNPGKWYGKVCGSRTSSSGGLRFVGFQYKDGGSWGTVVWHTYNPLPVVNGNYVYNWYYGGGNPSRDWQIFLYGQPNDWYDIGMEWPGQL